MTITPDDLNAGDHVIILHSTRSAVFPDGETRDVENLVLYGPPFRIEAVNLPYILATVPVKYRPSLEGAERVILDNRANLKLGRPSPAYVNAWWPASPDAPTVTKGSIFGGS